MEIQQRIRGTVLAQVHQFGGNLIRIGEGLQQMARRPELAGAEPAPALTARLEEPPAEVYAAEVEEPHTAALASVEAAQIAGDPVAKEVVLAAEAEIEVAAEPAKAAAAAEAAPEPSKALNRKGKRSRRA